MKNNCCPLCKSREYEVRKRLNYAASKYLIVECRNCSHLFTHFDEEIDSEELYNDNVYKVIDNVNSVYTRIINRESKHILKLTRKFCPCGSTLLDFGSGKGLFLNIARNYKYNVLGVETAMRRANYSEDKFDLKIIKSFYEKGKISDDAFDVITLFHVLEHLSSPKEILFNLVDCNLKESGLLIIEVPNFSSFQSFLSGSKWMHLDVPRHLSHFTKKRIKKTLRELKLEIIKEEYFSSHLGVLGMVHSIMARLGYNGSLIYELKNYKKATIVKALFILPIAVVIEYLAAKLSFGGIMRFYCTPTT